jgi:hypothetical protein
MGFILVPPPLTSTSGAPALQSGFLSLVASAGKQLMELPNELATKAFIVFTPPPRWSVKGDSGVRKFIVL